MSDIALFGLCLACGAALSAIYFLFGFLRKSGGVVGTVLCDIAFALLVFAPLFALAYLYNDGIITAYMAVGEGGALLLGIFGLKKLSGRLRSKERLKRQKEENTDKT